MRVSLYGSGQLNRNVAEILRRRSGLEILGPYSRAERDTALKSGADVVVVATTSFLAQVAGDLLDAVSAGSNVITTAEEAAFPWAIDAKIAGSIDETARACGVTVLGTGINPGLAFDALVLTATGAAWDVDGLQVERVVDLSRFSATILRRLGIGYTQQEFDAGIAGGTIFGHIGFPQSIRIVAAALGVELERLDRHIEPILAEHPYRAVNLSISTGTTAGFRQRYTGVVAERPWFEAIFTGHVDPQDNGTPPRDEIFVRGTTPIHFVVDPGFDPQSGSSAVVANSVQRVVDAQPGWLTVADLPPARPDRLSQISA